MLVNGICFQKFFFLISNLLFCVLISDFVLLNNCYYTKTSNILKLISYGIISSQCGLNSDIFICFSISFMHKDLSVKLNIPLFTLKIESVIWICNIVE